MTNNRLRNPLIASTFLFVVVLTGLSFSYNGFVNAKDACIESNGTITEENISYLGMSWSVSCEK